MALCFHATVSFLDHAGGIQILLGEKLGRCLLPGLGKTDGWEPRRRLVKKHVLLASPCALSCMCGRYSGYPVLGEIDVDCLANINHFVFTKSRLHFPLNLMNTYRLINVARSNIELIYRDSETLHVVAAHPSR